MKNNLDPKMQARLDKWRANPLPVKSLIDLKRKGMFIARRQTQHDIDDEEEYIQSEQRKNNPNFKGHT